VYILFLCSTYNTSSNLTLPDTDICWENVDLTRIGAYRIFLVSWFMEEYKVEDEKGEELEDITVYGLFGF
jgi:hypothetical protein